MRWKYNPKISESKVTTLSKLLNNLPHSLCKILLQRGIDDFEKAKQFFRPELSQLHDPFLMCDMDKAVNRLSKAIGNCEKILIYGDYDVDGTTAVATVYSFLKEYTSNIEYYIPDRYTEGYGISFQSIDFAAENGFNLVIALDCGIKAVDKIDYANQKNVDFIICDHHLPGNEIPKAAAVLDPKRKDCPYPFKGLSGCGVGFKLLQGFCQQQDIDEKKLMSNLDLLAISIAADIVPIVDENRVLAFYGLKQINSKPRPGVKSLIELANIRRKLTISDVVFYIAPRINAAGRIDSGKKAVAVMLADAENALDKGRKVHRNNDERRQLDKQITEEALDMIDSDANLINKKTTVVYNENWHKGVVGIVASRLIESYYRPTIVLTKSEGVITGSARSVKYFDVHNAINECSDLLEKFGGHKAAAGLSLLPEKLDDFIKKFEQVVSSQITAEMLVPEIEVDAEINLEDITAKFYRILAQFDPCGPDNPKPIFVARNLFVKNEIQVMAEKHIKFEAFQKENPKKSLIVIAFGMIALKDRIKENQPFDIAFHIEENEFRGKSSIQLIVKDIKLNEPIS